MPQQTIRFHSLRVQWDMLHTTWLVQHKNIFYASLRTLFVLWGLLCTGLALALVLSAPLRDSAQVLLAQWGKPNQADILHARLQIQRAPYTVSVAAGSQRQAQSSPITLDDLTPPQAKVAQWISRRYHVAEDAIAPWVAEAWEIATEKKMKPTLLLAVAAIESRFNPIAQSRFGAQGLMQVRTSVHKNRYTEHGGVHAAFHPLTNLRVGADILHEYIRRYGTIRKGLIAYVGAAFSGNHGGYPNKVLKIQKQLNTVVAKATPVAKTPIAKKSTGNTTAQNTQIGKTKKASTAEKAGTSGLSPQSAQAAYRRSLKALSDQSAIALMLFNPFGFTPRAYV